MANATVEKIKDLGLRHGEKVVVGLAAALCLVFAWQAFSRPTIDLTPEQIERSPSERPPTSTPQQDAKEIAEKLVEDGMTNPGFEKIVDLQVHSPLKADPLSREPLDHPRAGRGADPRAARPGRTGEPLRLSRPWRGPGLRPRRAGQADPRGSGEGRSRQAVARGKRSGRAAAVRWPSRHGRDAAWPGWPGQP